MVARIQKFQGFVYLYGSDNKIMKSEKLPMSGSTAIASQKLRVWAEKNGVEVK